jgi:hypothetical protein
LIRLVVRKIICEYQNDGPVRSLNCIPQRVVPEPGLPGSRYGDRRVGYEEAGRIFRSTGSEESAMMKKIIKTGVALLL